MTEPGPTSAAAPTGLTGPPASDDVAAGAEDPWCGIDLGVYEQHMSHTHVGQLQLLHQITADQLAAHPSRTVGVLGIAGGNGLDLLDPSTTDAVYGYDINPDYLTACRARHGERLGDRLRLVHARIEATLSIDPVGLLIANLIVEYVGLDPFAAFAAANASRIGVLSCVIQRNDAAGFVSATPHTAAFTALGPHSSDIQASALESALREVGFTITGHHQYPLPNGKTLIRQDFRPTP